MVNSPDGCAMGASVMLVAPRMEVVREQTEKLMHILPSRPLQLLPTLGRSADYGTNASRFGGMSGNKALSCFRGAKQTSSRGWVTWHYSGRSRRLGAINRMLWLTERAFGVA